MVYVNPAGFPTPGLGDIGWKVFISLVVMVITAGCFVAVRIGARIAAGQLGADDYAIIASMTSFIIQTTLWALSVRSGYGAEYLKLEEAQRIAFTKWWFFGSVFWIITITMYKVSVLLLLNRIFIQRPFRIACWTVLAVCVSWSIANWFSWIFQCRPIPVMWGDIPEGAPFKCINQSAMLVSLATWDVTIDVAALILPQPMVWKLNLKKREKIMLAGMFCLGAVVVVFSLLSCSAIVTHLEAAATQKNTYSFALANLFQVLEAGVGIIGACLPIMRQPLKRLWPHIVGSSKRKPPNYYDDGFSDQYVLQQVSGSKKGGARNSVSVSGPEFFRSNPRKSDELGIIDESREVGDAESDQAQSGSTGSRKAIKKEVAYRVDRSRH